MRHAIKNRARTLLPLTLAALALLGGCANTHPPTFRAVGVSEVSRDHDRSVIEFLVEATNPNREPIPLKRVSYRVEIGGEVVFTGVRSAETTLHTYSSHVFALPAVLPASTLGGAGEVHYAVTGSATYIPPGRLAEVLFDAEIAVPEAPIELSGTINTGS